MTESALVQSIGSWLYDKKAKDIIALKVAHLTVITDYMVIASGRNVTQVNQAERTYYNLERLWEDGSNRLPLPFDQTVED